MPGKKDKDLNLLKGQISTDSSDSSKLDIDLDAVQNIVSKMKKTQSSKGGSSPIVEGHLKELRDIIAEGKLSTLSIDTEAKLAGGEGSSKSAAQLYKPFKLIIDNIVRFILKNQIGKKIAYYLYSANSKSSLVQHLVLSTIYSLVISGFISILFLIFFTVLNPILLIALPFIAIGVFVLTLFILCYMMPMQQANMRGVLIDIELPYALRHLATELQAGMGLYKTLQSIARNDYGVLSDELNRTILEIENGTDTKTALRHTALRSQSKNFNIALFHIVRTLNTGGNLTLTINSVADNVSFDLMEAAKAFGEKMNFFGIIFIFTAIVLPVFVAILGSIANAPLSQDGSAFLPGIMSPQLISVIFMLIMPVIFAFILFYIKMIEPKM
ncbi:MAG: type II secretion system F family protein [archaeon]